MINNRQQAGRRRGRGSNGNGSNGNSPRQGGQGRPDNGNRIDNRARGNANQLYEKYKTLASDAQRQGDRVNTEYYLQFADHYFRVISDQRGRFEDQQPRRQQPDFDIDGNDEDYGDEGDPIRAGDQQGERDRNDRQDRADRNDRQQGQDRPQDRQQGQDRGDRQGQDRQQERHGQDRYAPQDRQDRPERQDRQDRPERQDRQDRPDRQREARRPDGEQRPERPRRWDRDDRPRFQEGDVDANQSTVQVANQSAGQSDAAARPEHRQPEVAGQHRADPVAPGENLEARAEAMIQADAPLQVEPAPRKRGRPRRDAQPVTAEAAPAPVQPSLDIESNGVDADRLPPSLGASLASAANDAGDDTPKPRRRRIRAASPGEASAG